jgi:hypothetical protein
MKKDIFKIVKYTFLSLGIALLTGCVDLDPDPLSMYEPEKTFTSKSGLDAAMVTCDQTFRLFYYYERAAYMEEILFSDVAVGGETDKTTVEQDLTRLFAPTNTFNTFYFWQEGFWGVKYANTILTYIDDIEGLAEDQKAQYKALAYFHRAWRYYHLLFQFGDIPYLDGLVNKAKTNYRSTKMSVIIDKMTQDLEFAVIYAPQQSDYGKANKGSARMLLIKYYLARGNEGDFDKAIKQADTLINNSGYELMQNNFGTFENPFPTVRNITRNVIWDLHRPMNKSISANKEAIQTTVSRHEVSVSRAALTTMRNYTPFWAGGYIFTPGGVVGITNGTTSTPYITDVYGRGVAYARPTYYAEKAIWTDPDDLRHSHSTGNWFRMEDLVYNHPNLKNSTEKDSLGKHISKFSKTGKLLCTDTIRCWFDWPYYKLWIEDKDNANKGNYVGGAGDWYIYRLAEAYLLRAEAYFWKGDLTNAAADINKIRARARCTQMFSSSDMNLGVIFDERARELMYEELRHVELVRASYIFAKQGKTDEFGNTYSDPTPAGLAQNSYWWARIDKYNNYYNKGVTHKMGVTYTISRHHLFWPIRQSEIDRNTDAVLNQNYGYPGYENNIAPIDNLEEAINANRD